MSDTPRRAPARPPTAELVRDALGAVVEREGGGPPGWPEAMAHYLRLLLERNASVNLVSRRTAGEVLTRHALPSLAALPLLEPGRPIRLLDIGSGGGFPGIPLRILRPEVRLDLVEATRNKCRFLEECLAEFGWEESAAHWCRIETPTESLVERGPFDLALARAVGANDLLSRAAPRLLPPGGGAGLWVFASPATGRATFPDATGSPVTALERLA